MKCKFENESDTTSSIVEASGTTFSSKMQPLIDDLNACEANATLMNAEILRLTTLSDS